jgi:hypothetical protein
MNEISPGIIQCFTEQNLKVFPQWFIGCKWSAKDFTPQLVSDFYHYQMQDIQLPPLLQSIEIWMEEKKINYEDISHEPDVIIDTFFHATQRPDYNENSIIILKTRFENYLPPIGFYNVKELFEGYCADNNICKDYIRVYQDKVINKFLKHENPNYNEKNFYFLKRELKNLLSHLDELIISEGRDNSQFYMTICEYYAFYHAEEEQDDSPFEKKVNFYYENDPNDFLKLLQDFWKENNPQSPDPILPPNELKEFLLKRSEKDDIQIPKRKSVIDYKAQINRQDFWYRYHNEPPENEQEMNDFFENNYYQLIIEFYKKHQPNKPLPDDTKTILEFYVNYYKEFYRDRSPVHVLQFYKRYNPGKICNKRKEIQDFYDKHFKRVIMDFYAFNNLYQDIPDENELIQFYKENIHNPNFMDPNLASLSKFNNYEEIKTTNYDDYGKSDNNEMNTHESPLSPEPEKNSISPSPVYCSSQQQSQQHSPPLSPVYLPKNQTNENECNESPFIDENYVIQEEERRKREEEEKERLWREKEEKKYKQLKLSFKPIPKINKQKIITSPPHINQSIPKNPITSPPLITSPPMFSPPHSHSHLLTLPSSIPHINPPSKYGVDEYVKIIKMSEEESYSDSPDTARWKYNLDEALKREEENRKKRQEENIKKLLEMNNTTDLSPDILEDPKYKEKLIPKIINPLSLIQPSTSPPQPLPPSKPITELIAKLPPEKKNIFIDSSDENTEAEIDKILKSSSSDIDLECSDDNTIIEEANKEYEKKGEHFDDSNDNSSSYEETPKMNTQNNIEQENKKPQSQPKKQSKKQSQPFIYQGLTYNKLHRPFSPEEYKKKTKKKTKSNEVPKNKQPLNKTQPINTKNKKKNKTHQYNKKQRPDENASENEIIQWNKNNKNQGREWYGLFNTQYRLKEENLTREDLCQNENYPIGEFNYPDNLPFLENWEKTNPLFNIPEKPIYESGLFNFSCNALFHRIPLNIDDTPEVYSNLHYWRHFIVDKPIEKIYGGNKAIFKEFYAQVCVRNYKDIDNLDSEFLPIIDIKEYFKQYKPDKNIPEKEIIEYIETHDDDYMEEDGDHPIRTAYIDWFEKYGNKKIVIIKDDNGKEKKSEVKGEVKNDDKKINTDLGNNSQVPSPPLSENSANLISKITGISVEDVITISNKPLSPKEYLDLCEEEINMISVLNEISNEAIMNSLNDPIVCETIKQIQKIKIEDPESFNQLLQNYKEDPKSFIAGYKSYCNNIKLMNTQHPPPTPQNQMSETNAQNIQNHPIPPINQMSETNIQNDPPKNNNEPSPTLQNIQNNKEEKKDSNIIKRKKESNEITKEIKKSTKKKKIINENDDEDSDKDYEYVKFKIDRREFNKKILPTDYDENDILKNVFYPTINKKPKAYEIPFGFYPKLIPNTNNNYQFIKILDKSDLYEIDQKHLKYHEDLFKKIFSINLNWEKNWHIDDKFWNSQIKPSQFYFLQSTIYKIHIDLKSQFIRKEFNQILNNEYPQKPIFEPSDFNLTSPPPPLIIPIPVSHPPSLIIPQINGMSRQNTPNLNQVSETNPQNQTNANQIFIVPIQQGLLPIPNKSNYELIIENIQKNLDYKQLLPFYNQLNHEERIELTKFLPKRYTQIYPLLSGNYETNNLEIAMKKLDDFQNKYKNETFLVLSNITDLAKNTESLKEKINLLNRFEQLQFNSKLKSNSSAMFKYLLRNIHIKDFDLEDYEKYSTQKEIIKSTREEFDDPNNDGMVYYQSIEATALMNAFVNSDDMTNEYLFFFMIRRDIHPKHIGYLIGNCNNKVEYKFWTDLIINSGKPKLIQRLKACENLYNNWDKKKPWTEYINEIRNMDEAMGINFTYQEDVFPDSPFDSHQNSPFHSPSPSQSQPH